jgi:antitoxin CcdA
MNSRTSTGRRRSVNLTISEDVMEAAKALELNASRAAEAGIIEAVRQARAQAWRRENEAAIEAHNARVEKDGVLLTPDWAVQE